jgi:hypothetical protein
MFHPTGTKRAVIYWRRRLLVMAVVVVVGLTMYVSCSSGSGRPAAAPASSTTMAVPHPVRPSTTPPPARRRPVATNGCAAGALKVRAVTSAPGYRVGDQPSLALQVTNTGKAPCVQDLADGQIELRVYNGESRVWASHDCRLEPGTSPHSLPVGTAVRRSVVWSGLSSQPRCAGQRVRVGPGTYTLHALLSGHEGATATFTIS